MNKKVLAMVMAVVLLMTAAISGTIAWLTDDTDPVVNTFTVGNIDITLTETGAVEDETNKVWENSYKMIPGNTIDKDPKVTVEAGSEACWLFVKVTETGPIDDYLTYAMDSCWTVVPGQTDVYYYNGTELDAQLTADKTFNVIGNKGAEGNGAFVANKILVKTTVTKEMMDSLNASGAATLPQLKFTAYAVQKANVADAATAWSYVENP